MPSQYLRVKNLDRYQHYKDRNPPWVKLHRDFLSDYELRQCSVQSRLLFACCLILASETDNLIPNDVIYISQRIGMDVKGEHVSELITKGMLLAVCKRPASKKLAPSATRSVSVSSLSSEGMQGEGNFESFWLAYPKKVGRKAAEKAWSKAKDKPAIADILTAISRASQSDQWKKEHGQYIPNPATWINQGRWSDQPMTNGHDALTCEDCHKTFQDPKTLKTHRFAYHPKWEG